VCVRKQKYRAEDRKDMWAIFSTSSFSRDWRHTRIFCDLVTLKVISIKKTPRTWSISEENSRREEFILTRKTQSHRTFLSNQPWYTLSPILPIWPREKPHSQTHLLMSLALAPPLITACPSKMSLPLSHKHWVIILILYLFLCYTYVSLNSPPPSSSPPTHIN